MISRELIKAEIDRIDESYLELLYKIIRAMDTPTVVAANRLGNEELSSRQSGAEFLLSLAGAFNSGPNDTSERTRATIIEFVQAKHSKPGNNHPD